MKTINFKAVIFDMDGVLIDSQPLHYEVDMGVLKSCGYPATLDDVQHYTGKSNPDRWPEYRATLNLSPSVDELIRIQEDLMRKIFLQDGLMPIDGVPELLQHLKANQIPCAVASSTAHELVCLVLKHIGIFDYFDAIVSGEDVAHGKPAPDVYLKAAEKIGISPEYCVAIEDSPAGMLSAKRANMTCVAFKNPNTWGQEFSHADVVINHFDEFLKLPEVNNL